MAKSKFPDPKELTALVKDQDKDEKALAKINQTITAAGTDAAKDMAALKKAAKDLKD
jgi:hypothetical protein